MSAGHQLRRAKEIFSEALDAPSAERARRVRELAAGDTALECEVLELLALHEEPAPLTVDRPVARFRPGDELAGGRYRIEAFIGSGGMGEVYRALDTGSGQRVAIKTIRPLPGSASGGQIEQRFLREVRMAQKINHPNVCRIFALEEDAVTGQRFCAMDLFEGDTLAERIRARGRLSPDEAERVAGDLCAGLAAAHDAGVVHRDLKPGNVMLTDGRAVIIDFGLAAALTPDAQHSLTGDGEVIGTLAYMAPEQLADGTASTASDIYALGVTMYEMLIGQKPHSAASPLRLAARKATATAKLDAPGIPAVWREVITRCLRAEPAERYQNAREVERALRRRRPTARFLLAQPRVAVPALTAVAALAGALGWWWLRNGYVATPAAQSFYEQAQAALTEGAAVRGVRLVEQAIAKDPEFLSARALAAAGYAELDQPERAREELLSAAGVVEGRWRVGRGEQAALRAARAAVAGQHHLAAEQYRQWAAELPAGPGRAYAQLAAARAMDHAGEPEAALAAVEAVVRENPDGTAARVRLGLLYARAQQYDRAGLEFQKAEEAYSRSGNQEGLCDLLLARVAARLGDRAADRRDLDRVLALSAKTGNRYHELTAKLRMAVVHVGELDYDGGVKLAREAAEQARRYGMPVVAAQALGELGYGFAFKKRFDLAEPFLRESVELAGRARATGVLANNRMRLGEVLGGLQRTDEAVSVMEPAIVWQRNYGRREMLPLALQKWGNIVAATPRFAEAEGIYREALDLAAADGNELYQSMALERIAGFLSSRTPVKAAEYWDRALVLARKTRLIRVFALAARNAVQLGQFTRAGALLTEGEAETRKHPPGVDRVNFESLMLSLRTMAAYVSGDCTKAGRLALTAERLAPGLALEMHSFDCSAGAKMERDRRDWSLHHRAFYSARAAAVYLRTGDTLAARTVATQGLAASHQFGYRLHAFENMIALRAAERGLGNAAEAERLGASALRLAAELGFDPPARFGGRRDLLALWHGRPVHRR